MIFGVYLAFAVYFVGMLFVLLSLIPERKSMDATELGFSISFLTAEPGAGKSYSVVKDLIDNRLPRTDHKIITNLPLVLDEVCPEIAKRKGCSEDEVRERIILLTPERLKRWRSGEGGPWEYFTGVDDEGVSPVAGFDLLLDEVHNFCPADEQKRMKRWNEWLGEARHEGWARILFISQDESKVGKPIKTHTSVRWELTKPDKDRDPYFGIPLSHWYEIKAGLTGKLSEIVTRTEFRRRAGKLKPGPVDFFLIDDNYFRFYQSFSVPGGGAASGAAVAATREFQKRKMWRWSKQSGKLLAPLPLWFLGRHWYRFASRFALLAFGVWFFAYGGLATCMGMLQKSMTAGGTSKTIASASAPSSSLVSGKTPVNAVPSTVVRPTKAKEYIPPGGLPDRAGWGREGASGVDESAEDDEKSSEPELPFVAMMGRDYVVIRGGESISVGNRFEIGPLVGLTLERVDWSARRGYLSDGTVVMLGSNVVRLSSLEPPVSADATTTRSDGGTFIPADLQRTLEARAAANRRKRQRQASDSLSR